MKIIFALLFSLKSFASYDANVQRKNIYDWGQSVLENQLSETEFWKILTSVGQSLSLDEQNYLEDLYAKMKQRGLKTNCNFWQDHLCGGSLVVRSLPEKPEVVQSPERNFQPIAESDLKYEPSKTKSYKWYWIGGAAVLGFLLLQGNRLSIDFPGANQ